MTEVSETPSQGVQNADLTSLIRRYPIRPHSQTSQEYAKPQDYLLLVITLFFNDQSKNINV